METLLLDLIVVDEELLQIGEVTAPKEILKALITNHVIAQGENFKIGNIFTVGQILSTGFCQVVVVQTKHLKV